MHESAVAGRAPFYEFSSCVFQKTILCCCLHLMAFGLPVLQHITFTYDDKRYICSTSHDALVSVGKLSY